MQGSSRPGQQDHASRLNRFYRIGGNLSIDFANSYVSTDNTEDALDSWSDLVSLLSALGIVHPNQIEALERLDVDSPQETVRTLHVAFLLRDGIRQALTAIAGRQGVPGEAVEAVNGVLRLTEGYDQLAPAGGAWRLQFVQREKRLEWLLAAIARSAADLIVEGRKAPVRKCGNPACVLYFYDTSRTGRRRWCSMAVCGNRNKVAAFAKRKRRKKG